MGQKGGAPFINAFKNDFCFALQFFLLISDSLGGVGMTPFENLAANNIL